MSILKPLLWPSGSERRDRCASVLLGFLLDFKKAYRGARQISEEAFFMGSYSQHLRRVRNESANFEEVITALGKPEAFYSNKFESISRDLGVQCQPLILRRTKTIRWFDQTFLKLSMREYGLIDCEIKEVLDTMELPEK